MELTVQLPRRVIDAYGRGTFRAPRGKKQHMGVDYVCPLDTSSQHQLTARSHA